MIVKIGLDATNLNDGGGKTHIKSIISQFVTEPTKDTRLVVWGSSLLLGEIADSELVEKRTHKLLNGGLVSRYIWLLFYSKRELEDEGCDILFSPGGLYFGRFRPFVTMSRNMLLYDYLEVSRLGPKLRLKIYFSRLMQQISFKNASGIIFLSNYARGVVNKSIKGLTSRQAVVHHGIDKVFENSCRELMTVDKGRINILYVSRFLPYKNQLILVQAVVDILRAGRVVYLYLVGGGNVEDLDKIINCIPEDIRENFVIVKEINHSELVSYYHQADMFVFSSSCENMPNILIEAMRSGLPICCSNIQPMPEFLKDGGVYFDPRSVESTKNAILEMLNSDALIAESSRKSLSYSKIYSWRETSAKTFEFVRMCIKD